MERYSRITAVAGPPLQHSNIRAALAKGHCSPSRRQHRGFMGSSRREEALKKPSAFGSASGNLPSPPREHEESPGKRSPPSTNGCLQANAAAAASATPTHLFTASSISFSGDLAALLGPYSGMMAGMVATLSSSPQALHRSHHASSSPLTLFLAGNGTSLFYRLAFAWQPCPGVQVSTCMQHFVACQLRGWLRVLTRDH